jgi:CelD/BcsL family acetyltransferase involved in cellulose biosynthesis
MGVNDVLSRESLRPHWASIAGFLRREMPFALLMRWQCVLENGCAVTHAPSPSGLRHTHQSKYLRFAAGWDAFLAGYSANFRAGIGKKIRRLERLGQVRVDTYSEPAQLLTAFESFLQVEDSGWKGAMGTSILKQPPVLEYYRYLLAHLGRLGLCRVSLLFLDNTVVAGQFGIEIGDCLYLLKIGFREDYGSHSPGAVLLYKLVQHYCQHGPAKTISFVTSVSWIDRWHPSSVQAGVFYTDCDSALSKAAVWLVRWLKPGSRRQVGAAPMDAVEPEAE